ncbi:MAG: DNA-binding protein [Calditrichaeota bacterium]|nr:MAG: DNA-binding protein [Calditrichota bacterium]MBL1207127.1 DNA-binding protein [Calditrichota bacterium]NOG46957.1 helix-turn-helix domain-containing protein [Calditrichota bacterium]
MDRDHKISYWPGTEELTKPAKEVAKILNIHYNTLFRWIKSGNIECVRFGRSSIHFTYDQVENLINENRELVKVNGDI